jgi:hypothetical protein
VPRLGDGVFVPRRCRACDDTDYLAQLHPNDELDVLVHAAGVLDVRSGRVVERWWVRVGAGLLHRSTTLAEAVDFAATEGRNRARPAWLIAQDATAHPIAWGR